MNAQQTNLTLTSCSAPLNASELVRVRFFDGQCVTKEDLNDFQKYFLQKSRLQNRIHGWGIVCGAAVRAGEGDCEVIVEQGHILDARGRDILIPDRVTVNLCTEDPDGNVLSLCTDSLDPWCSNIRVERRAGKTCYLAVRYAECLVRPVRVAPMGCSCNETECEYTRIQESCDFQLLEDLPRHYLDPLPEPDFNEAISCVRPEGEDIIRACPPCPSEPWVILADITLNTDGSVSDNDIDNFAHRRHVASFANYYYLCSALGLAELRVEPSQINGDEGAEGTVVLTGPAQAGGAQVALSSNSTLATVPASVIIPAGQTTASFGINTLSTGIRATVILTASFNGINRTANLEIRGGFVNRITLETLTVSPSTVSGGETARGQVVLTGPALVGGAQVTLSSSNSTSATVPASVTIPAGQDTASFDIRTTLRGGTAEITASFDGISRTANLEIRRGGFVPLITLETLTVNPSRVSVGDTAQGRVVLTGPARAGGAQVALSSNSTSATVPASVTIPVDQTTASFTINTFPGEGTAEITASFGGVDMDVTLTITGNLAPLDN